MKELTSASQSMLHAILAMGLLLLTMFLWMYATRLPAFARAGIDPQQAMHPGTYHDRIPSKVRRVADTYNHLFEAPTLFCAISIAIILVGSADGLHVMCAWGYVALRVAHSIVQATANKVVVRFALFALSWVMMGTMIVRAAAASF